MKTTNLDADNSRVFPSMTHEPIETTQMKEKTADKARVSETLGS
jgi:hypothetical protein